jgi:hypothetical protein
MGMETIEAYVTEVKTKVPVSSSLTADELVLKTAYVNFLTDTRIDQILPGVDFSLNLVENYLLLKEHISVHQYYMGIENERPVSFDDAARHWAKTLYFPVIAIIESSGLHHAFRDLTLTDLYLWLLDQQQTLQEDLGIALKAENVLDYAADQEGIKTESAWSTAEEQIMQVLLRDEEQPQNPYQDCLFQHVTAALSEDDPDWIALEQAILVNRCPGGAIRGVHVESPGTQKPDEEIDVYQQRFNNRLTDAGMSGNFFLRQGEPASALLEFSLLSDLLVLKLSHPPATRLMDRISHGIITILQQSQRPVLFVKENPLPVNSILLPFDGRQRSKEALYVAAYYAARYESKLHLLLITKGSDKDEVNRYYAQTYLERLGVNAEYHEGTAESFTADVVSLAENLSVSTLILGGYETVFLPFCESTLHDRSPLMTQVVEGPH